MKNVDLLVFDPDGIEESLVEDIRIIDDSSTDPVSIAKSAEGPAQECASGAFVSESINFTVVVRLPDEDADDIEVFPFIRSSCTRCLETNGFVRILATLQAIVLRHCKILGA